MADKKPGTLSGSLIVRKGAATAASFGDSPLRERETVTKGRPAGRATASSRSKKILIAENNELDRTLLQDLMEVQGHSSLCAKEGQQALALAREHHPDLILMDICMPEISGLEVTRRLKGDDDLKSIPVIAVTALDGLENEAMIRAAGCDSYVVKPISIGNFLEIVERYFD